LAEPSRLSLAFVLFAISLTACGPRRLTLPTGAGAPASDYLSAWTAARHACDSVRSLQAELALSGRAGSQRMRGRVLAGIVPGALRLEGVAPFGSPVFILVADGDRGTMLLLRDRRILQDAAPEEILNALVGVSLGPDDLLAVLVGCVQSGADPVAGLAYGADWRAVELASGATIYLHQQNGKWRIVAGRHKGLEVDYTAFGLERPTQVVLRGADLNLMLTLSQVEVNGDLTREQLVGLKVPPGLTPITLDELRRAVPVGE
jgi:hypothetical protein